MKPLFAILMIVASLVMTACGGGGIFSTSTPVPTNTPEPTATPDVSEAFKIRADDFIEAGTLLTALTEQGITYKEFTDELANVKTALVLANDKWPPSPFGQDAREHFDLAITGWNLTLDLWSLKIGEKDNPTAPDINRYQVFVDYGGDELYLDVHEDTFIVEDYRGKQYLPFDENIGILMSLASSHFNAGKKMLNAAIP